MLLYRFFVRRPLYGVSRHLCRPGDGSRTRRRPRRVVVGRAPVNGRRRPDVRVRGRAPLRGVRRVRRRRPGGLPRPAARFHTHGHGHAHAAGRLRRARPATIDAGGSAAEHTSDTRRGGVEETKVLGGEFYLFY